MTGAFLFFEPNHAEFAPGLAFLNRHYSVVFNFRLEMSVLPRFLPERVNFRPARRSHDVSEPFRFRLQQFHAGC